jgi:hypothetical protein
MPVVFAVALINVQTGSEAVLAFGCVICTRVGSLFATVCFLVRGHEAILIVSYMSLLLFSGHLTGHLFIVIFITFI